MKIVSMLLSVILFSLTGAALVHSTGVAAYSPPTNTQPDIEFVEVMLVILCALAILTVLALLKYYLKRKTSKYRLANSLDKQKVVRSLNAYEKLIINDIFLREVNTRFTEGYHNKRPHADNTVYSLTGDFKQHSLHSTRGILSSYQTINDYEVLIPVAALPYLRDENNSIEFVMIDNLAFAISVNKKYKALNSSTEKEEPVYTKNAIDDSNRKVRMSHSRPILGVPTNTDVYFKDIKGNNLLLSTSDTHKDLLKVSIGLFWFFFGILLFLLFTVFFLGITIAEFSKALDTTLHFFMSLWPFAQLLFLLLIVGLIIHALIMATPSSKHLLIFNNKDRTVIFAHHNLITEIIKWEELYTLIESATWMNSLALDSNQNILELATKDRNAEDRISVRFEFSSYERAVGAWQAIQLFMEGKLYKIEETEIEWIEDKENLSQFKRILFKIISILLGGKVISWLGALMLKIRIKRTWKKVLHNSMAKT